MYTEISKKKKIRRDNNYTHGAVEQIKLEGINICREYKIMNIEEQELFNPKAKQYHSEKIKRIEAARKHRIKQNAWRFKIINPACVDNF